MRIAILAWGSLIWCPRELAVTSKWALGPALPVEFARVSTDDRVTLVLGGEVLSTTYWALSACDKLDRACTNLFEREGRPRRHDIHFTTGDGLETMNGHEPSEHSLDVANVVAEWLDTIPGIDSAVWTGLPPRGLGGVDDGLARRVVDHLASVDDRVRARVEEYVRFAPETIRTPVREALEEAPLNWVPRPLPPNLFEGLS